MEIGSDSKSRTFCPKKGLMFCEIESGAHDRGVYFIQKDALDRVIPCSPNKLRFSDVASIRPGRRMLPIGFQTVAKTNGSKNLAALDKKIEDLVARLRKMQS